MIELLKDAYLEEASIYKVYNELKILKENREALINSLLVYDFDNRKLFVGSLNDDLRCVNCIVINIFHIICIENIFDSYEMFKYNIIGIVKNNIIDGIVYVGGMLEKVNNRYPKVILSKKSVEIFRQNCFNSDGDCREYKTTLRNTKNGIFIELKSVDCNTNHWRKIIVCKITSTLSLYYSLIPIVGHMKLVYFNSKKDFPSVIEILVNLELFESELYHNLNNYDSILEKYERVNKEYLKGMKN